MTHQLPTQFTCYPNGRPAPRPAPRPTMSRQDRSKYVHLFWLIPVWVMQYGCIIPSLFGLYFTMLFLEWSVKACVFCLGLLFAPRAAAGFVLGATLSGRHHKRHYPYPSRPWGASLIK